MKSRWWGGGTGVYAHEGRYFVTEVEVGVSFGLVGGEIPDLGRGFVAVMVKMEDGVRDLQSFWCSLIRVLGRRLYSSILIKVTLPRTIS